jgi:hypothetical protein
MSQAKNMKRKTCKFSWYSTHVIAIKVKGVSVETFSALFVKCLNVLMLVQRGFIL